MKQKANKMKISEVINELNTDLDDERFDELWKQVEKRTPFSYLLERLETLDNKIEELERLQQHQHSKDGKVLFEK